MKLLTLSARKNLISALLILLISGLSLFFILKAVVREEIDEQLMLNVHRVESLLRQGKIPNDPLVKVAPYPNRAGNTTFSDTTIFDPGEEEEETYRKVSTIRQVAGSTYRIEIASSLVEWEDFYSIIFWVFLATSALLLLSGIWVNQQISRNIWQPFFNNLKALQEFSLSGQEKLKLQRGKVSEFEQLHDVLEKMAENLREDYQTLKDFTETASHEIQTPLAIINSKLDQLQQNQNLDENSAQQIEGIRDALNRLSKLNKNLLLLTKIENRQFNRDEHFVLQDILDQNLNLMKEIFAARHITLHRTTTEKLAPSGNRQLAEILISNLLSNAYRYTPTHGDVHIIEGENELWIKNTAKASGLNESKIYTRFYKGEESSSSNGLGLAIALHICQLHNWKLSYYFENKKHVFHLHF